VRPLFGRRGISLASAAMPSVDNASSLKPQASSVQNLIANFSGYVLEQPAVAVSHYERCALDNQPQQRQRRFSRAQLDTRCQAAFDVSHSKQRIGPSAARHTLRVPLSRTQTLRPRAAVRYPDVRRADVEIPEEAQRDSQSTSCGIDSELHTVCIGDSVANLVLGIRADVRSCRAVRR
jgi:hypothetical protein